MAKRTENPADCQIRAVIRFLQAKNIQPADIHRQVCEVYGEVCFDDVVGNLKVVEITCTTTNAAVAPVS